MAGEIERLQAAAKAEQESGRAGGETTGNAPRLNASRSIASLRKALGDWFQFYDGYDPEFAWWMKTPFKTVEIWYPSRVKPTTLKK